MAMDGQWRDLILCLWPGLPGTWREGRVLSLLVAISFAVSVQVALVVQFVWPELILPAARPVVCFGVVIAWAVFVFRNLSFAWRKPPPKMVGDLFESAQREYLKGNWPEVKRLLEERLAVEPTDVEARLLLATAFRRSDCVTEAMAELERLAAEPHCQFWKEEIRTERSLAAAGGGEPQSIAAEPRDAA
ncbi:MAG: hypothetical protein AAGF97_13625 [Planctomycetota bacterium]